MGSSGRLFDSGSNGEEWRTKVAGMSFAFFGSMLVVAEDGDRVKDRQMVEELCKEVRGSRLREAAQFDWQVGRLSIVART